MNAGFSLLEALLFGVFLSVLGLITCQFVADISQQLRAVSQQAHTLNELTCAIRLLQEDLMHAQLPLVHTDTHDVRMRRRCATGERQHVQWQVTTHNRLTRTVGTYDAGIQEWTHKKKSVIAQHIKQIVCTMESPQAHSSYTVLTGTISAITATQATCRVRTWNPPHVPHA